jgi:hypothetical protein
LSEIWAKRLQILKEAVLSASRVWYLTTPAEVGGEQLFREASRLLQTSVLRMPLRESTPLELQRVFAEVAPDRPDAIIVSSIGDLGAHARLIVELIEIATYRRCIRIAGTQRRAG